MKGCQSLVPQWIPILNPHSTSPYHIREKVDSWVLHGRLIYRQGFFTCFSVGYNPGWVASFNCLTIRDFSAILIN